MRGSKGGICNGSATPGRGSRGTFCVSYAYEKDEKLSDESEYPPKFTAHRTLENSIKSCVCVELWNLVQADCPGIENPVPKRR